MSISDFNEPIWVDSPQTLENLAALLAKESIFAVDTESNSLFAYREQVCLIQISTNDEDYLIDPLALKDLSPWDHYLPTGKLKRFFMPVNMI